MLINKLTVKQLDKLKDEFNLLVTIEEKFRFWIERLNYSYAWVGVNVPTNDVNDFLIIPRTPEEKEELNLRLLDEIEIIYSIDPSSPFVYSEVLIKDLMNKLEGVINLEPVLDDAIAMIKKIEDKHKHESNFKNSDFKKAALSKAWIDSYNNYYQKGDDINYALIPSYMYSIIGAHNGAEMAKYRMYIERTEWNVSKNQIAPVREETPLKKQLLIMEYSGMLKTLDKIQYQQKYKLLSSLLNASENTIKQEVINLSKGSHVYRVRTEENLTYLYNLLSEVGLNDKAEEVKNELDKLKQIKK